MTSGMSSSSAHSAGPSALGYLYQCQWALFELLRGTALRPDCALSVEVHDDIAWDSDGAPVDLLQLKHHTSTKRSLGDKDEDLWRTLRVWMDAHDVTDQHGPTLTLITTQRAAEGSAAEALRPHGRESETTRDESKALALLMNAAETSRAVSTQQTRDRFLALSEPARKTFVSRIIVLDSSPSIVDIDQLVRDELRWGLPRGHETRFMAQVWDWWYRLTIRMLNGDPAKVNALQIQTFIDDLRDTYTRDNLPTLVPDDALSNEQVVQYDEFLFVHQMRWVDTPPVNLQMAVLDYYRAVTQTALWLEDDLVGIDELDRFERKLIDEWRREFEWVITELAEDADEQTKRRAGRELLRKLLAQTAITVRDRYSEPFFSRGKHHELANDQHVGWHPEFKNRIESLLMARAS